MDNRDFETLYQIHVKQVYRFLLRLCKDPHTAEELTQETFVRAFLNLDDFKGSCRLYVWLCQIGKNLYYTLLKKEGRRSSLEDIRCLPDMSSVEETVLDWDTAKKILDTLSRLPEPYQTVFLFRVIQESSYRDIGSGFGKSEVWARVTYYRGKTMLQEKLKEDWGYEM